MRTDVDKDASAESFFVAELVEEGEAAQRGPDSAIPVGCVALLYRACSRGQWLRG